MNKKISLFVLAAGMGSRYGGLKQMEGFGPSGETIIDYSIYDAVKAGFDKFIFVIRPDMEEAFKDIFIKRYGDKIDISYVFQSVDMVPDWYKLNPERTKPWGTGQALLVAKDVLKDPFYIISSDDFFGSKTFGYVAEFLRNDCSEKLYSIPVYKLKTVLSDKGTLKRGICYADGEYLEKMEETFEVEAIGNGMVKGVTYDGRPVEVSWEVGAGMSSYGVHPSFFKHLEERFFEFLKENKDHLTGELLLPTILNDMVQEGLIKIKLIETDEEWFGVTHKDDAPIVRKKLQELVDKGVYPEKLVL